MKKYLFLCLFLVISQFVFTQNHPEFTFDLRISTNVVMEVDGEWLNGNHKYKLEKHDSYCTLNKFEYEFHQNDTLLLRYFDDFKLLFEQPAFYRRFNNTCPRLWDEYQHSDGTKTTFWFNSDSVDIAFAADDRICNINSLYDSILNNFFNIALYIARQPETNGRFPETTLAMLSFDEGTTCSSPIRVVNKSPLIYRLKGRVYEYSYKYVLEFLNGLPPDEKTTIEVGSGFYINVHDSFYHPFKAFIRKAKNIVWVPDNDRIADDLKNLGIKKRYIIKPGR